MSWYSDREPFDEYDPPYCKYCSIIPTAEYCRECQKERDGVLSDELDKRTSYKEW